jgi:hypothetical protein
MGKKQRRSGEGSNGSLPTTGKGGGMGNLEIIFATVVAVLSALAVIGALVFAIVWEWCAIRRTLTAHRREVPESFWRDHAA